MSRRIHPIDDAFRSKLEHYASDTPDYLWQGIARQRTLRVRVHNRWRERALLAAALLLFVFAGTLSWQMRELKPTIGSFPVALGLTTTEPRAEDLNKKTQAIATAPPIFISTNRQFASTPLLSTMPIAIESLSEQMATTLQILSDEIPATGSAVSRSALQLTALPLALQEAHRTKDLPFNLSKCAPFGNREKMRFYFDILASPDFTSRKIQASSSDFNAYAKEREATEQSRYNYSVGVRLSAVTSSGLALRSGVNYSEIKERLEFAKENEVRVVITKKFGPTGDIIGIDTTTETYTRRLMTNNTYRTIDIPILLGYEKRFKKVTLTANGGAYVNVLFKQKGAFLSPYDNLPVSFTATENPEDAPAFREKLGIGWYGSIGMNYKISPSLHLMIEPHLKMYPRSFTNDHFMTDQKYLTAGVFVGLRHQFAL